ncbi:hypothetical protein BP5796_01994 [Coleophoma crateriformis]|uniref:tRNA(Phe) 7-[(3-amino-3-carboxypropyl)-4-demethylwyosine(37)-N(4)]-methyltransferase n=1 Tax=Coleophoma crateriformis TaxID=565419 RepID=A0A3D8T245_9HELO|nr:hypothetical protein BP5796_01994 [Coleophoma crateriformis]
MAPSKPQATSSLPASFLSKKAKILSSLSVPNAEYDDLSPKGSVDEGIRELIDEINQLEGCVTTSSCAGRVSVFLEGKRAKKGDFAEENDGSSREKVTVAGVGGKGAGGRWLFVSHDPVDLEKAGTDLVKLLGMQEGDGGLLSRKENVTRTGDVRFIHFKFEPMILHVLTASLAQAQIVLAAALQAGFRESGALNLLPTGTEDATPMVGIRTMGLSLESLIGYAENDGEKETCTVGEDCLRTLLEISNERFVENQKRIQRFRTLLMATPSERLGEDGKVWEDADVRRKRMREEGLKRKLEKENVVDAEKMDEEEDMQLEFPNENT